MRSLPVLAIAVLAAPLTAGETDVRQPAPPEQASRAAVEVWTGVEYEEGDYGTGRKVRRLSVPNTVRMGVGRLEVAASLPYTRIEGPANAVAGGGLLGLPIIIDPTKPSTRDRRDGLGDLTVGAAYHIPTRIVDLKASAEAKLPTASKNLGTGKTDYAIAAQASKSVGAVTPFVGIGYTVPGDPEAYELSNSVSLTGGVAASLGPKTRGFVSYSRADHVNENLPDEQQVTTGLNTALSDGLSLGLYGAAGLSRSSPDVGAGLRLGVRIK